MAAGKRSGSAKKNKKGAAKGTGGHGRKALAGRGATPRAEDRTYHPAYHRKAAAQKREMAKKRVQPAVLRGSNSLVSRRAREEMIAGRNSVLESLCAGVPAEKLFVAVNLDSDGRVKEIFKLAAEQGVSISQLYKPELDQLTDGLVHQGVVLQVRPYEYRDALEVADTVLAEWEKGYRKQPPLLVAFDGITDPHNVGAIIRSVSAFNGDAVIIPDRRSAGVTASAWKTSAGAVSRVCVTRTSNLSQLLDRIKESGYFVAGLEADGEVSLPEFELGQEPLCIVMGSEGLGLGRLVTEKCDVIVSIPINSEMESLNVSVAAGIVLYNVMAARKV